MSLRNAIIEQLRVNRPKLGESSLTTYGSTLMSIPKQMDAEPEGVQWYSDNADAILRHVVDATPMKRKTMLSALFVLTGEKKVHEQMLEDAQHVNARYKEQRMTPKEEQNWVDWDEIVALQQQMSVRADQLFKARTLTPADATFLVRFVLLSCFVLFPPRRPADYAAMKLRVFDKNADNYVDLKKGVMVFNQYKTKAFFGTQKFPVPPPLLKIFRAWAKINARELLLHSTTGTQMTSSSVGKALNSLFDGKKVSANMIRHSFLTDFYSDSMPSLNHMEDTAKKMAHSVGTAMQYIKRDAHDA